MLKDRSLSKMYDVCSAEGSFIPIQKDDLKKIKTMLSIAIVDYESVKVWKNGADKKGNQWNAIYKLYYDILHQLIEAYVRLDKVKARVHECLFAYICFKHPELELSWDFFEKIRTKRNGSLYYGSLINYSDWKEIEFQMELYVGVFIKELKGKVEK